MYSYIKKRKIEKDIVYIDLHMNIEIDIFVVYRHQPVVKENATKEPSASHFAAVKGEDMLTAGARMFPLSSM